jgi:hypothetical protein
MSNQPPPAGQKGNRRQVRVEYAADLEVTFSNAVIVASTANEFALDFLVLLPNNPRSRVKQRIVMTPTGAKSFLQALAKQIERFEAQHGEIRTPPTLADQLFRAIAPDDNPQDEDDDE